ncbi:Aste57867_22361 [Aphanomyces stellatus]|uniref:Aste57867_22361 protein n=1 Tax=Aphanomyces stellatus TaxID=120398 RepID=A0A485LLD3_9STRA|nr:hypothetical protein As57867_022291 [Aphanomyces stellatus]VFT99024.1 Aste57867_22361 [Aphanomyces stellatus]
MAPGTKLAADAADEAVFLDENTKSAAGIVDTDARYPASSSSVAHLNKQLRELEVRYHRTRLVLEKATLKSEHVQKEVRKLRGENQQLDQDLQKKKALVAHLERVGVEKKQIEAQAIANRDYAKRIEQKIAMGAKGHATATRQTELAARIRELEADLATQQDACREKEAHHSDAVAKISILKRSLEVRLREMGLDGSIHNGMLYEIARLQDVNAGLAMQIALEVDQAAVLQDVVAKKDAEIHALEYQRIRAESTIAAREQDLAAVAEKMHGVQTDADELADEKRMLLAYIQEQTEKLMAADAALKKLQAVYKQTTEAMHVAQRAHDEREADAAASLATNQQAYDKLLQAYSITQDALAHERAGGDVLRAAVQDKTLALERVHQEVGEVVASNVNTQQLQNARDESQQWRIHVDEIEAKCAFLETDAVGFKDTIRSLQTQLHTAEALVAHHANQAAQLEASRVQSAADFDALVKERNDAARAMNEAVTISASSLDEQHTLTQQVAAQKTQIDQLKQSKSLLQNAMLEQLAAVRKQLQMERIARLTSEGKLNQLRATSSAATLAMGFAASVASVADSTTPTESHVSSAVPCSASTTQTEGAIGATVEMLTLQDLAGSSR